STTPSRAFFSLPSSCAFAGSPQIFGSSSARRTSSSFFDFRSKTKHPPHLGRPRFEVGERVGELVGLLGFHEGAEFNMPARFPRYAAGLCAHDNLVAVALTSLVPFPR